MSTADSDLRREAIRNKLAQCAGRKPDANAIAAATVELWPQVAARLAPVIGARGVEVLFNRALHLTSTAFPWLAIAGDRGRGAAPLDGIRARLARQDAAAAAGASCALLFSFTDLLANLIGESLTQRLLGPVWASPVPASEQETGT